MNLGFACCRVHADSFLIGFGHESPLIITNSKSNSAKSFQRWTCCTSVHFERGWKLFVSGLQKRFGTHWTYLLSISQNVPNVCLKSSHSLSQLTDRTSEGVYEVKETNWTRTRFIVKTQREKNSNSTKNKTKQQQPDIAQRIQLKSTGAAEGPQEKPTEEGQALKQRDSCLWSERILKYIQRKTTVTQSSNFGRQSAWCKIKTKKYLKPSKTTQLICSYTLFSHGHTQTSAGATAGVQQPLFYSVRGLPSRL